MENEIKKKKKSQYILPLSLSGYKHNEPLEILARKLIGLEGLRDLLIENPGPARKNLFFISISNTINNIEESNDLNPFDSTIIDHGGIPESETYAMIRVFEGVADAENFVTDFELSCDPGGASYILIESLDGNHLERGFNRKVSVDYSVYIQKS